SLVRSSAIVPMLVMAARCFLRLSQMVMPVFSFGWRRKQSRLTPADARRCATKSPNESCPTTPMNPVRAPNRARLKTVIALDPPRTRSIPPASFSVLNSSSGAPFTIRSTFESPATMQSSILSVFMNSHALHYPRDHAVGAGIIGIQSRLQTEMIGEQLREYDFKRRSQKIRQAGSGRRNKVVEE